jgi:hypothetical protein
MRGCTIYKSALSIYPLGVLDLFFPLESLPPVHTACDAAWRNFAVRVCRSILIWMLQAEGNLQFAAPRRELYMNHGSRRGSIARLRGGEDAMSWRLQ